MKRMGTKGKEKRECFRFKIPGSTLTYKKTGFFSSSGAYEEELCPILDMSLGGLRFLTQKNLKTNTKLSMRVTPHEDSESFHLSGKVKWTIPNPGVSYKYQVGVQFDPYGDKDGFNNPEEYEKLRLLEDEYGKEENE